MLQVRRLLKAVESLRRQGRGKTCLKMVRSWEGLHILLLTDQKIVVWPHIAAREDGNTRVCLTAISVTMDAGGQLEVSVP